MEQDDAFREEDEIWINKNADVITKLALKYHFQGVVDHVSGAHGCPPDRCLHSAAHRPAS